MANLTATLSDVNGSFPVSQGGSGGGGGGTTSALSLLSKGLGALTDHWDNQAKAKRQAAQDARQAKADLRTDTADEVGDRTLRGLAAIDDYESRPAPQMPAPESASQLPIPPELEQQPSELGGEDITSIQKSVGRLNSMDAAVEQGRMPDLSRKAQQDILRNKLFEQYSGRPGALQEVARVFKDQGIDLFPDITAEQEFSEAEQKAKTAEFFKVIEIGKSLSPYDPNVSDQQYYARGRQYQADETARLALKEINIERRAEEAEGRARRGEDRTQLQFDREEEDRLQFADGQSEMYNTMGPALQTFLTLSQSGPGVGQSAEYETKMAAVTAQLQAAYNAARSSILRNVKDPATANALAARLEADFKDVILDPIVTKREAFGAAAKSLDTAFKMRMNAAAPFIRQLKAQGIDIEDIAPTIDALSEDQRRLIQRELTFSLNPKLSPDVGKIHMAHAIEMLKGEKGLRDMTEPQGRQFLTKYSATYTRNMVERIARGEGNAEHWLNAAAQLPTAAASVSRGSGAEVLGAAMASMVGEPQINALNKLMADPSKAEQARLVALSSRAGVAHITDETKQSAIKYAQQEYQNLVFNRNTGQFQLAFNSRAWAAANPRRDPSGGIGWKVPIAPTPKPAAPSATLTKLVKNLNAGVVYLTTTTKWEPETAPSGPWKEVAEFWAIGNIEGTSLDKKGGSRKKEADAIAAIDKFSEDLGNPARFVVAPDSGEIPGEGTKYERRVTDEGAGNLKVGYIPEEVKTNGQFVDYGKSLIRRGQESSATGIYQITYSTMEDFGPKALGPNWRNMPFDAQAQDAVAKKIYEHAQSRPDPVKALMDRWTSLNRKEAAALIKKPWEQARRMIAKGESGAA